MSDDYRLALRLRYAATAAGYEGLRELTEAIDTPGLSYRTLRRLSSGQPIAAPREDVAAAVAEHCRERGANIPESWLLHGFGDLPTEPPGSRGSS